MEEMFLPDDIHRLLNKLQMLTDFIVRYFDPSKHPGAEKECEDIIHYLRHVLGELEGMVAAQPQDGSYFFLMVMAENSVNSALRETTLARKAIYDKELKNSREGLLRLLTNKRIEIQKKGKTFLAEQPPMGPFTRPPLIPFQTEEGPTFGDLLMGAFPS